MSDDPKLEQLIEQWEDLRQEGREVSAEQLCRDCPGLLRAAETSDRVPQINGLAFGERFF